MGRRAAVLPEACDHFLGDSEHHAPGGEWRVEQPRLRWEILEAFRQAATRYGIPAVDDFNTGDNEGSCYFHVNQRRGRRWSAARGFLKPVLQPAESGWNRLPGRRRRFRATRDAACAGAQKASAQRACRGEVILLGRRHRLAAALLLSGVGPAAHAAPSRHSARARQARRGREPAGPSAAPRDLSGQRREHPEHAYTFAAGPPRMGLDMRCAGAGR